MRIRRLGSLDGARGLLTASMLFTSAGSAVAACFFVGQPMVSTEGLKILQSSGLPRHAHVDPVQIDVQFRCDVDTRYRLSMRSAQRTAAPSDWVSIGRTEALEMMAKPVLRSVGGIPLNIGLGGTPVGGYAGFAVRDKIYEASVELKARDEPVAKLTPLPRSISGSVVMDLSY